MVNPVLRLVSRTIRKYLKLVLACILTCMLGVTMYIGMTSVQKSLDYSCANYIDEYGMADIVVTTDFLAINQYKTILESFPEIQEVNGRIACNLLMKTTDDTVYSVVAYSEVPGGFQQTYVFEDFRKPDELSIYVDSEFARLNGIHAGDKVRLELAGNEQVFNISKIMTSPECLGHYIDVFCIGSDKTFGFVYLPSEYFSEFGYYNRCNQFLIKTTDGYNRSYVLDKVLKMFDDLQVHVVASYSREQSPSELRLEYNLNAIRMIGIFLPILFYSATTVVQSLFLIQIVKLNRRENGILIANGFSRRKVCGFYHILGFVVSLLSIVPGIPLGWCLVKPLVNLFTNSMYIVDPSCLINVPMMILSVFFAFLFTQLAVLVATKDVRKLQVVQVISGNTTDNRSRKDFGVKTRNPLAKYCLLSSFRNIRRLVFTIVCISTTVVLVFGALSYNSSNSHVVDEVFDERCFYDVRATFSSEVDDSFVEDLNGFEGVEGFGYSYGWIRKISANGFSSEVTIVGYDEDSVYYGIDVKPGQIVIDTILADALKVKVGDKVLVGDSSFVVSRISEQGIMRTQYVCSADMDKLGNPDRFFVIMDGEVDEQAMFRFLDKYDDFMYVIFRTFSRDYQTYLFDLINTPVRIIIAFAVVIGLVAVVNTVQTTLQDQKSELCVILSLGFHRSQISKTWYIQTLIQFAVSCLIGLPLGSFAIKFLMSFLKNEHGYIAYYVTCKQYLISALIILFYLSLSHIMALNSMKRWNIAENVKDKQ